MAVGGEDGEGGAVGEAAHGGGPAGRVGDSLGEGPLRMTGVVWAGVRDEHAVGAVGGQPAGVHRRFHGRGVGRVPVEQRGEHVGGLVLGGPAAGLHLRAAVQCPRDLVQQARWYGIGDGQMQVPAFVRRAGVGAEGHGRSGVAPGQCGGFPRRERGGAGCGRHGPARRRDDVGGDTGQRHEGGGEDRLRVGVLGDQPVQADP
ncbi:MULTISPECIES: hypothetical protein [unclassified Streptomyces]|uniref:hypothetical protein n=1 Tax=unclassified Streptomyces TaxID=2593676 RepID=UPI0034302D46